MEGVSVSLDSHLNSMIGETKRGRKPGFIATGIAVALCVLFSTYVLTNSREGYRPTVLEDDLSGKSDAQLQTMQERVQARLVEAAKRDALAEEHHVQALKLKEGSKADELESELLEKKSELKRYAAKAK